MATIFDQAENAQSQYVPKFVGSNFELASNVAEKLDQRYRANKDLSDKVAITLAQEQYLDNDKAIKEELSKNIYGQINKIASSDKNFENSSAAVSNLARDFFTNQNRLSAIENFKRVQQAKALRTQLGANALNFGDNPDNFSTLDENGQPRLFNNQIEERANYAQEMQRLLGKVAEDGYYIKPTGETMKFNDTDRYLIKTGQVEKLGKDKLNDLIEGLLPVYKTTGAGQQDLRRLTQLQGLTTDPIKINEGNITRQTTAVDQDIRNRFRALAYPQSYQKTFGRFEDFGQKAGAMNAVSSGLGYTPTLPGSPVDNTSIDVLPDLDSANNDTILAERDKSGNIVGHYMYVDKSTGKPVKIVNLPQATTNNGLEPVVNLDYQEEMSRLKRVDVDPKHVEGTLNKQYDNLVNRFPAIQQYYGNYDNYKKAYNEAAKHLYRVTPTGNVIQPEQAENYKKIINATAAVSPIYFKSGTAKSLDEFAKDIGTEPQNIQFEPISVYYDSPNKDMPGGYIEARVKTGVGEGKQVKGAPSTVFIPVSDQFSELARPIDDVYKNSLYKGHDTYTPDHPYVPGINQYDSNGNVQSSLAIYTQTYPKRVQDQQNGKPGFETFVFEGDIVPNGSGGQDVRWNSEPIKINDWKNLMLQRTAPMFQQILNSGQTANPQDYKKRGIDF